MGHLFYLGNAKEITKYKWELMYFKRSILLRILNFERE